MENERERIRFGITFERHGQSYKNYIVSFNVVQINNFIIVCLFKKEKMEMQRPDRKRSVAKWKQHQNYEFVQLVKTVIVLIFS